MDGWANRLRNRGFDVWKTPFFAQKTRDAYCIHTHKKQPQQTFAKRMLFLDFSSQNKNKKRPYQLHNRARRIADST